MSFQFTRKQVRIFSRALISMRSLSFIVAVWTLTELTPWELILSRQHRTWWRYTSSERRTLPNETKSPAIMKQHSFGTHRSFCDLTTGRTSRAPSPEKAASYKLLSTWREWHPNCKSHAPKSALSNSLLSLYTDLRDPRARRKPLSQHTRLQARSPTTRHALKSEWKCFGQASPLKPKSPQARRHLLHKQIDFVSLNRHRQASLVPNSVLLGTDHGPPRNRRSLKIRPALTFRLGSLRAKLPFTMSMMMLT